MYHCIIGSMISYQKIKDHFDDQAAEGEIAPSTAKHYTTTIRKVLDDLGCDMDDVADCIDMELVKYINAGYINVGTRQAVFLSFLKAIDTLPALQIDVEPRVRDAILEGYETSKNAARERAIQTQLTEKVERMDEIVAKIERHFAPPGDEVLLVNIALHSNLFPKYRIRRLVENFCQNWFKIFESREWGSQEICIFITRVIRIEKPPHARPLPPHRPPPPLPPPLAIPPPRYHRHRPWIESRTLRRRPTPATALRIATRPRWDSG